MTPLIRLMTMAVLPITLLISMSHIVGAHGNPGDGFTAGIISSLGLTLQYVVFGYGEAHARFRRIPYLTVLIAGLGIALLAAGLPLLAGQPVLADLEAQFYVPLIGTIRLARAMLFDIGIYFVVFGGAMTSIDNLGRMLS